MHQYGGGKHGHRCTPAAAGSHLQVRPLVSSFPAVVTVEIGQKRLNQLSLGDLIVRSDEVLRIRELPVLEVKAFLTRAHASFRTDRKIRLRLWHTRVFAAVIALPCDLLCTRKRGQPLVECDAREARVELTDVGVPSGRD